MNVTETLNEGLKRAYVLTIPAADIEAKVAAAIAEVAPRVRMPGFRPGKVPGNLIRRMHGPALRAEAVQEAVSEGVKQLLADRSLRPAMQPAIDLESDPADGSDIRVHVALEVLPEVPEAKVDGIALERLVVEVDEAAVDAALAQLAGQQKRFTDAPAGHRAAPGDLVVMDFAGTIDGQAFEGGTGTGMEIELGSGRLIPGFEAQLEGVAAGEAREVRLAIPADYPRADIAGREAVFAVTVRAVRTAEVPPVDDQLAINLGLQSLAQLREVLRERVEAELRGLTRTHMKRKLLDHLAATYRFEVPPSMVDAEFAQIWRQLTEGATAEELAEAEGERAEYARIAERRVRLGLLLSDIGTRNGVTISQAEMNRLVAQEAARYPGEEAEVRRHFAENPLAAAQLRAPLFEEKVVDFLISKAEVTERRVTRAELEAAIESEDETPVAGAAEAAAPAQTGQAEKAAEKPGRSPRAGATGQGADDGSPAAGPKADAAGAQAPAGRRRKTAAAAVDGPIEPGDGPEPPSGRPRTRKAAAKA